jgi:hypothetical protein
MSRSEMITGYFLSVRNFALAIALIVEVDALGWAYGPFTDAFTARWISPTPTYPRLVAFSTRPSSHLTALDLPSPLLSHGRLFR